MWSPLPSHGRVAFKIVKTGKEKSGKETLTGLHYVLPQFIYPSLSMHILGHAVKWTMISLAIPLVWHAPRREECFSVDKKKKENETWKTSPVGDGTRKQTDQGAKWKRENDTGIDESKWTSLRLRGVPWGHETGFSALLYQSSRLISLGSGPSRLAITPWRDGNLQDGEENISEKILGEWEYGVKRGRMT